jgi:hypothetical protein
VVGQKFAWAVRNSEGRVVVGPLGCVSACMGSLGALGYAWGSWAWVVTLGRLGAFGRSGGTLGSFGSGPKSSAAGRLGGAVE